MDQSAHPRAGSPGRRTAHAVLDEVVDRPAQLTGFRRRLRTQLEEQGLDERARESLVLASAEALNNALQRCDLPACRIEVTVSLIADHVCIEVRDTTEGFKGVCVELIEGAALDQEHGRGLYLMRELVDSLELVPREHGMLVRMIKRLEAGDRADKQATAC